MKYICHHLPGTITFILISARCIGMLPVSFNCLITSRACKGTNLLWLTPGNVSSGASSKKHLKSSDKLEFTNHLAGVVFLCLSLVDLGLFNKLKRSFSHQPLYCNAHFVHAGYMIPTEIFICLNVSVCGISCSTVVPL